MTSLTVFRQSDFSELETSNLLGKGGYESVQKLQRKSTGNYYAVKILEVENDANFLEEINLINQLNYSTVLHLKGITLSNPKYIITFYCPKGNVQTYIDKAFKGDQDSIWTSAEKIIILLGTSFGMKYLHSKNIIYQINS